MINQVVLSLSLFSISIIVQAEQVTIGVGEFPPYVIKAGETGIELDIIKEALKGSKYTPKFEFLPYARILKSFQKKKIDGAININKGLFPDRYYSNDVLTFSNFAITLKSRNIKLKSIEQLSEYNITAWQNASVLLPESFSNAVEKAPLYRESSDQSAQVKMLFIKRSDVLIINDYTFKFYREKLKKSDLHLVEELSQKVEYSDLFPSLPVSFAFNSKPLNQAFNQGLNRLKSNGKLEEILEKYR